MNTQYRSLMKWSPAVMVLLVYAVSASPAAAERVLFDFGGAFDATGVEARDTQVALTDSNGDQALRLATGHDATWPGITLKPDRDRWDLSGFEYVIVDVRNVGEGRVAVSLRIDSPGPDGPNIFDQAGTDLDPGQETTLKLPIKHGLPPALAPRLFGMRGYPGGLSPKSGIDPENVVQLLVFVNRPSTDHVVEIDNIRAGGSYEAPEWLSATPEEFFPMIDRYGQFIHKQWPHKTVAEDDLKRHLEHEAADLQTHPGPQDWNLYGGWQAGPQLEATGHFRVEKHEGKWWLVDPAGRLFWSHGADCVRGTTGYTPITDRELCFAELPDKESPFGRFYGRGSWAPHGYYQDKERYEHYNFTGANLLRKYGTQWEDRFAELCHRRLRSWGMNSIGNWSEASIYLLRRTPYVTTVSSGRKPLQGSTGYWGKFPDVFDSEFAAKLRKSLAGQRELTADDPWCIGVFVDNELSWGDELSLARATLASPPEQVAKRTFVDDLRAKYETIEQLNRVWGTDHVSWAALLDNREAPPAEKARDDLAAFATKTAEQYFRVCREA